MLRLFTLSFTLIICTCAVQAQTNTLLVSDKPAAFALFTTAATATICIDNNDAKVVAIAGDAFANDVQLISGKQMQVLHQLPAAGFSIVAGTIGKSKFIDELIKSKEIDVSTINNKWECFTIQVIKSQPKVKGSKSPLGGLGGLLVIAGSDRRGTAFGIFHLSRLMGVSPFVWWADAVPEKKQQLFISGSYTSTTPSVQYRGIFINDEDWGMQPWAAKNMDTDIKDIGPKTYAKVFELLLRLKANYIWPAMHPCTKAFYYYKQNPKVADAYAIVVGGSHCEPMLRNNVCEWAETYEEEYKKKPGEWRYDVNKDEIYKYWDDRIKESVKYESVFTVGMRGVHDGSMPGPKDPNEKLTLLENVITDQRQILQNNFKTSPDKLPQIFVPYKEVLSLYRRGMKLPDDVTIIWPDDNHGYIRQLPNEAEQKRSGGHGVYYHLSYWGSPHDYLWLSSISPALIGYEMKKAYDYGAKKLWVFNVGDIKPAELETQFAMDMAWDIKTYNAASPATYLRKWAAENFGESLADEIVAIKEMYYRLALSGKPEHLGMLGFTQKEMDRRIESYEKLMRLTDACQAKVKPELANAFNQLIDYPVSGAAYLNYKILHERSAANALQANDIEMAKTHVGIASQSFELIKNITELYNNQNAGKWRGMMSWHPRDQKVFNAPAVFDSLKIKTDSFLIRKKIKEARLVKIFTAADLFQNKNMGNAVLLPGVGVSGSAITVGAVASKAEINFKLPLSAGSYQVFIKCLPVFAMETTKQLTYSIAFNSGAVQTANVHVEAETAGWKENVVRGYSEGMTQHVVDNDGTSAITIILNNKNLVISQVEIYKAQ